MKRNKFRLFTAIVIFLLIGIIIGYIFGTERALILCVKTGERILNISLNDAALNTLITRFPEINSLFN